MKEFNLLMPKNLVINFTSPEDITVDTSTRLVSQAYLPGVNWLGGIVNNPNYQISFKESDQPQFIANGRLINIHDKWHGKISLDLWHLIYSVTRSHFLENSLFPVHSAVAGLDYHALMVGHSGVGKTSVMLKMNEEYGWKIYSGNKTLVSFDGKNPLEAAAGTRTITTRTADLFRQTSLPSAGVSYGDRSAQLLYMNKYEHRNSVPLKAIFLPKLNDGVSEVEQMSPLSALHHLYPYFLDTISADTVMCKGKFVYKGITPNGVEKGLARNLSKSLKDVPVYKIAGSMRFVTENIAEVFEKTK